MGVASGMYNFRDLIPWNIEGDPDRVTGVPRGCSAALQPAGFAALRHSTGSPTKFCNQFQHQHIIQCGYTLILTIGQSRYGLFPTSPSDLTMIAH
jgi:hypothetical protein